MHCNWVKQKSFASALLDAQSCLEAHWVEETASTNDDVKEWVRKADEDIAVALVTDRQTAGRGTRGRRWTAPAASVLLTVGVPLSVSEGDLSGLSPVVGAACAESLWKLNPDVRLKWPNDLWIGNGKAAGILCELVRNRAHRLHAVVGIGVNMCLGKIGVPTTDVPAAAVLVQLPDVRKLEELTSDKKKPKKTEPEPDIYLENVRHIMESKLATMGDITQHKITISFNDDDDLNRILEIIDCLEERD